LNDWLQRYARVAQGNGQVFSRMSSAVPFWLPNKRASGRCWPIHWMRMLGVSIWAIASCRRRYGKTSCLCC